MGFQNITSPFRTPDNRYHQNVADAEGTYARPALMGTPDGPVPAVALFNAHNVKGVLPVKDALRIANQIADAIDFHKTRDNS